MLKGVLFDFFFFLEKNKMGKKISSNNCDKSVSDSNQPSCTTAVGFFVHGSVVDLYRNRAA
jgi:hypothetical protein